MSLEVELDAREKEALTMLVTSAEWPVMDKYLNGILKANRNTLEDRDDPLVRGDCKRCRRLLRLPDELLAQRRARPQTAPQAGG